MFEPNFHLGRERARWQHLVFFLALIAVAAILNSCGSTPSTAATPTITISCTPTEVFLLATSQCTATVLNLSSTLVNWSVTGGDPNGTINSGGLYKAPVTIPGNNNVITITAVSQVMGSLTATTSLTLQSPISIAAVTCEDAFRTQTLTVSSGNRLTCTAADSSGATVPVTWTVADAIMLAGNIGSISAQGIYLAPLVPPPGQKVTITATSLALTTDTVSVTATVVFGNAVLGSGSGSYAFSTTGNLATNAFWARVGSFSTGGGFLTNGIEDTNQGGAPNTVTTHRTFTGSYFVGPDGRGTMQFCEDTSASCPLGSLAVTAYFRIVVVSPSQVQLIEFSPQAPASATTIAEGEMLLQDQSVFGATNGNLFGAYSFNLSGVSTSSTEESVVGDFVADGFGHIAAGSALAPGQMDTTPSLAAQPVLFAASTYSIGTNGQGTITLGGLKFSVYPVSASRAKFIEIDTASIATPTMPASILVGDAFKQQTSSTCGWSTSIALAGTTVLETFGSSSGFAVANVGAFTANHGAVSSVLMDQNSAGTYTQPTGLPSDKYAMDADQCGRGTLSVAGHSYVFYVISPSNAVLQEITSGTVANGLLLASQGGVFADGSYAFRMAGTNAAGAAGQTEVLLGQFTSLTSNSVTSLNGSLDLNDFGATQTGLPINNGTFSASGGVRSTATLPIGNPLITTRKLVLYLVSPTLFYALDTGPAGTASGVISNQF